MKKVWEYGTSTPVQRIGVIFLSIGLISLFSWMIKEDLSVDDFFAPYFMPGSRDSLFYHLFLYFIPLGLLMSWGYQLLVAIKQWVLREERTSNIDREKPDPASTTMPQNLHFKSNLAAFKFATEHHIASMDKNKMSLGLVQETFSLKDDSQLFLIQLADKGRTTLVSGFNDKYAEDIKIGNLVYWGFVDLTEDDKVSATGHVLAILQPEFNPSQGRWAIYKDLT